MEKKNKMFYGWWIVIGSVLVTATMVPSAMAMANKFLIPVTTDMGISRSAFSLSNAILQAMGIFLSPYFTKKLAKGNLKRIQMFSIIIYSLVYATYALAKNPIHLYISSFILGIAFLGATMIPISIMITNWFDEKRGLAMSIGLGGVGIGGFILSPLLTSLLSNYGWRITYLIFAGIMLLVSLPVIFSDASGVKCSDCLYNGPFLWFRKCHGGCNATLNHFSNLRTKEVWRSIWVYR